MEKFAPQGVWCAMVTPYDAKGRIDYDAVGAILDFLIAHGIDGVFPVSNVGEFLLYSQQDKREMIDFVVRHAAGRLKIAPGVSDVSLEGCCELADYAAQAGCDAAVICAPYYYDMPKRYLFNFVHAVADRAELPLVLYNSPLFTNAFAFEDLLALCRHPNITGVKESSGNLQFLYTLTNALKAQECDIHVLLGFEELLLAGLPLGVCGCMVSSGGIVPEIMRGIYDRFHAGDQKSALAHAQALSRVTDAIKAHGFPLGYKMGVAARGIPMRLLRGAEFETLEMQLQQGIPALRQVIGRELTALGYPTGSGS